jgi:hypothetical protein
MRSPKEQFWILLVEILINSSKHHAEGMLKRNQDLGKNRKCDLTTLPSNRFSVSVLRSSQLVLILV